MATDDRYSDEMIKSLNCPAFILNFGLSTDYDELFSGVATLPFCSLDVAFR